MPCPSRDLWQPLAVPWRCRPWCQDLRVLDALTTICEACATQSDGCHLLFQGALNEQQPLAALLSAQGLAPHLRECVLYALAMADADQEPGARGAPARAGAAASAAPGVRHAGRTLEPLETGGAGASEPAARDGQLGGPCNGRAEPGRAAAESAPAAASRQDRSPAALACAPTERDSTASAGGPGAAQPGTLRDARAESGRSAEVERGSARAGQLHTPDAAAGGSPRSGGSSVNPEPGSEASGVLSAAQGRAALALYLESVGRCVWPAIGLASATAVAATVPRAACVHEGGGIMRC